MIKRRAAVKRAGSKIVSKSGPLSEKRARGRPREFDREKALEKAMQMFWALGYEATSMADLRAALGITQASLYAAFGSKEQLFREAVDLYRRTANSSTVRALETGRTAREAVQTMLQAAVDALSAPGTPGGCLIVLGATNCAPENRAVQDYLFSVRRQICGAILARLRKGQRDGDLPKAAPISALASYYATVLHGLALQSRDRVPRKALTHIAQIAMASWPQLSADVT
jgi:AcrR family transcriptional regulator